MNKRACLAVWLIACCGHVAGAVTPQEIHEGLQAEGYWVNWQTTPFDKFTHNAHLRFRQVQVVGVCWHPSLAAVQRARQLGCQLLIHHEPLFYDDNTPGVESDPGYAAKKHILDASGIVAYRSHDFQDRFPTYGVHAKWKQFLGLTGPEIANWNDYITVTQENVRTVWSWAEQFADRSKTLGQPAIRVIGNPDKMVSRISTGTGAVAWPQLAYQALAPDMAVCTEMTWIDDAYFALENDFPVIVMDHGVSELEGVKSCKNWMAGRWPTLTWHWIDNELEYVVLYGRQ